MKVPNGIVLGVLASALAATATAQTSRQYQPPKAICNHAPCPWSDGKWPWLGMLSGAPAPGTRIVLIDADGKIVSEAPVNQNGSYSVPAPRTQLKIAPSVCVVTEKGARACGKPGDNVPDLSIDGRQMRVVAGGASR